MSKTMLVNVTHVEESRVAIVDQGILESYDIETINRANIKGNIYNAVVESIHPSLEAAFVKITPDMKGFLPIDEVNFKLLPARVDSRKAGKIGQHLHPGQKIMAQVVREPFAGKPPTVSTYFSLPGRYLVLMPGVDSAGVSRKIEDSGQRERLKKIVEELNPPEGFGLIVRTAGVGQTKTELLRDLKYLLRLWQSVQRASQATEFPALVYREADLVIRTIRDHFTPDISEVWIDSQDTYDRALEFVRDVMSTKAKTLRLYTGDRPLFNKFNLEEQIESIYKRRVTLPSGGEIVIDGTEALTAIDVNSARSKRQGDAEDNALQTNLEAAAEIARQFRLRDLGGLIVIDFIDMAAARNRKSVEKTMRDTMRGDKAKYDVTTISKLGLMEIARQRIKGAKMAAMYATCPTCEGYGLIKNVESAALSALRKLQTRSARGDVGRIRLAVPPEVAAWILEFKKDDLEQIDRRQQVGVEVVAKPEMLRHQTEFETLPRDRAASPAPPLAVEPESPREARPAPVIAAVASPQEPEPPNLGRQGPESGAALPEPGQPRKRRRRRRRQAGRPAESGPEESGPGEPAPIEPAPVADEAPTSVAPSNPSNAEPFATPAGEVASAPGAEREGEGGGGKRRRRRRRRPRSGPPGQAGQPSQVGQPPDRAGRPVTPPPAPPPRGEHFEEETIPKSVRSDELMPAAARRGSRSSGRPSHPAGPARGRKGPRRGGAGSD